MIHWKLQVNDAIQLTMMCLMCEHPTFVIARAAGKVVQLQHISTPSSWHSSLTQWAHNCVFTAGHFDSAAQQCTVDIHKRSTYTLLYTLVCLTIILGVYVKVLLFMQSQTYDLVLSKNKQLSGTKSGTVNAEIERRGVFIKTDFGETILQRHFLCKRSGEFPGNFVRSDVIGISKCYGVHLLEIYCSIVCTYCTCGVCSRRVSRKGEWLANADD